MEILPHRLLTTLSLDVDFGGVIDVGPTPAGHRTIAPIDGGRFAGERLSGDVLRGGSDWVTTRADGNFLIDVRLGLRTDDGIGMALTYSGRFLGSADAMRRFRRGEQLDPGDYSLTIAARFECADPAYAWLSDAIVVGTGQQTPTGPVYRLFEVG